MGSETLPSTCYVLSDESSIPFYSIFPTNLVYPFTLRVTGIKEERYSRVPRLSPVTQLNGDMQAACEIKMRHLPAVYKFKRYGR